MKSLAPALKNVTISIAPEALAWARRTAAERNVSVSRFIGELVHGQMDQRREYQSAMQRYFSRGPFNVSGESERYPTRDEIYDRTRVR